MGVSVNVIDLVIATIPRSAYMAYFDTLLRFRPFDGALFA